ncbi:MAG: hypothetical protein LIO75_07815 [Lachnospiraceae bacterium]|nr:hypothetical protein [Lachnospiraceae bacterium]
MFKKKPWSVLAFALAAAVALSPISSYSVFAADETTDSSESVEDSATVTVTIDDTTEDPVSAIVNAVNNATEDTVIYLAEEPEDDAEEIVYSFGEPLTVPADISVSIIGQGDAEYILQAADEDACENSIQGTSSKTTRAFVIVSGSLTLNHVTIDANQHGRAVWLVAGATFVMESYAIVENGTLRATANVNQRGAGIYAAGIGTVRIGNECYLQNNTIYQVSYTARGAGFYGGTSCPLYLESGSHVSNNMIIETDNIFNEADGAGVYSSALHMDGCYIEGNQIINSGAAYGAGVYSGTASAETWTDVTVTENRIEHSGSYAAYGAGICTSTATNAYICMDGGTVSDNVITGEASYAYGAGIFVGNNGAYSMYTTVMTDVSITDNQIDCSEDTVSLGAGLYTSVIYTGGDMVIAENTINGEDGNFYSFSTEARYAAYLTEELGEDANICFTSYQASATGTYSAVTGASSYGYTMTVNDFAKLYYEDDDYDLVFSNGTAQVAGREPIGTGGTIYVETSEELVSALENASNRATGTDGADETGGTTDIVLMNDIELEEQPMLSSGRFATITSYEDNIYSIKAGTALSGTEMDTMFYVGGTLELTNVTLDAQQKGRVIQTLGGANLTIGEGATVTGGYAVSGTVYGVGINNAANAALTICDGSAVTGNTANDSSVTDEDGNMIYAKQAVGLGVYNQGTLVIDSGFITDNVDYEYDPNVGSYTGSSSGGIYNSSTGTVDIKDGTITGNGVGTNAGGIYTAGTVNISGNTVISGNRAYSGASYGGAGGGIYMVSGTVTLTGDGVEISDNEAMWGGGIYMSSSTTDFPTLNIDGAVIADNLTHISIVRAGAGGGIYVSNGATVNMTSGTISGNQVTLDDDVDLDSASSILLASLKTGGYGGGIYVAGAGSANSMVSEAEGVPVLNLSGGTITENYAYNGGSGIFVSNYCVGNSSTSGDYYLYGSGILNVSGSPVVSGNANDDDILLAASRYIDDDADYYEYTYRESASQTSEEPIVYTGLRKNIIDPVYVHIVGELGEDADLHVSKELLTYDAETEYTEERTYDYQFDGIIVEGSEDYEITEENLDSVLDAVNIDILTDGFWQLSATTVDVSDDDSDTSDETSESDSTDTGSEDTSFALTAIEGISLDVATAVSDDADLTYTGSELTPDILVTATVADETEDSTEGETADDASFTLTAGTDYTVAYENNTDAGTATYTITGTGRYQGTVTGEFAIEGKSLADDDVTVTPESELCLIDPDSDESQAQEPSVTVTANGTTLIEGEDYTLTYEDNDAVGTATVTVTGMGNYMDQASATFKIRYSGNSVTEETDAEGNTILCYETDGVVQTEYTGLVTYDAATYYVVNGVVDSTYTGLVESEDAIYYVADGVVASDYTGLVTDGENTWYVVDGVVDTAAETAVVDGLLYEITDGQASLYTGLYDGLQYADGALYTGELDGLQYVDGAPYTGELDGLQYEDGALYTGERDGLYYEDGELYTGIATIDGITYTVEDGVMTVRGDTLAARRNGNIYYFSSSITDPNAAVTRATYGRESDEVLVGDWNNDGVDFLVARRNGNIFYFTNSITDPDATVTRVTYGRESDEVLVGDWNGDGIDTLAIRRGNKFYFSSSNEDPDGNVFLVITYGKEDDEVLVGDWNNDGCDTLAVRRNGNVYYFSDSIEDANTGVLRITYGKATDEVLVGDWNGDGYDTLAARRNGIIYYFSNSIEEADTDVTRATYGRESDLIYAGTWK